MEQDALAGRLLSPAKEIILLSIEVINLPVLLKLIFSQGLFLAKLK